MTKATDVNGDEVEQNKEYRIDFSTGELVPVEDEDEDDSGA